MNASLPKSYDAIALRYEVEDFLNREADLVDERKFDEWLTLFSDDLQYRMPIVRNIAAPSIAHEYLTGPLDISWFDEGKETLATRVAQIKTGVHWAEEPLSRTSHLVTNVRIVKAEPSVADAREVEVSCKFLVYRNRNTDTEDTLIGRRADVLRRNGDSWLICRRTLYINQSVLLAGNLSFFV
ncbi:3-phenylpropionate/cinnamic acid dioxygenase subunit beta [Rhodoplanes sp. Z2-YC6860]|uniref:3-phenylpropionate/cinnamic acid dioxygenase subunit beta n=1 Tax=Rhodoplanes sp. Z2-YC6860 TaxID=674703 RepID=UPI00078C71FF|nr:3-phenylpropionate/cinnamic acid dioxygenase subunit beta [Rhodoplanes sp. Z2-YC6860]AMN41597.1 3-phenylpropionate dioxygenase subunit beta [Rhodoplanes sp. Z2-YC6860]